MKKLAITLAALTLAGCTSPDYAQYSKAQTDIAAARHSADAARYRALSDIAATGDSAAKVAAVMALAMGGQGGSGAQTAMQAPQASQVLQWAAILVPGLTQIAGMRYSYMSTVAQSNNSALVAQSTNSTFAAIAGRIQAPGSVTNNSLSGVGTLGGGAYATTDRHDATATTLSGTGTLGSGPYATADRHDTTDRNDVVTPAPVVVTPVTPVVPTVITPVVQVTPTVVPPTVITPVVQSPPAPEAAP